MIANDIHWQLNQSIVENSKGFSEREYTIAAFRIYSDRYIGQVGKLRPKAVTQKQAFDMVKRWHKHHKAPQGWKFGLAIEDDIGALGVVTVGRPVSRNLDDGVTFEITRLALMDTGIKNAASMLLGAACKSAKLHGASKIISYTLIEEDGSCYKAVGFHVDQITKGQSWSRDNRQRQDDHPTCDKMRWVKNL